MASVSHDMPCRRCWKELYVALITARQRYAVIRPMQHNRRYRDRWSRRQATLDLVEARVARSVAVAMAVRVDHHRHEIGVVEGRSRTIKGGVVETPGR